MKKMLIAAGMLTGILLAFNLVLSGCGHEAQIKETIAETDGVTVGVDTKEEKHYDYDKYGPMGKEVWDSIAYQWTEYGLDTEEELRIVMDGTYGDLSTKEELTQDILALPRNEKYAEESRERQKSLTVTETQPQINTEDIQQTTQASTQETKPVKKETQPAPKETQAQTQPAPTPTPQETQPTPTPQETQPTPAPQETQPQTNHGTTPGGAPLTGDPFIDQMLINSEQNGVQSTPGDHQKTGDQMDQDLEGITWN